MTNPSEASRDSNKRAPAAPPKLMQSTHTTAFLAHIEELRQLLLAQRVERESAGKAARAAADAAALAVHFRHIGDAPSADAAISEAVCALAESLGSRDEEDISFSNAASALATAQAFDAFIFTGTLGARSAPHMDWTSEPPRAPREPGVKAPRLNEDGAAVPTPSYTDEEWLQGLISAAHEIGRYANVMATAGDTHSVEAARAVVNALHEALQAFDLRNGPLRRSYDSLKYVVRRLEDLIYELSLFPPAGVPGHAPAPAVAAADVANAADGAGDAMTATAAVPLVDVAALEAARDAYAALDAAREALIKKCREPQKLAKQAISAMQRGDREGARKQLDTARALARQLLRQDVAAYPSLRSQGCLRGMLEELAEAVLFEAWSAQDGAQRGVQGSEPHHILLCGDEALLGADMHPSEYLGGVCDLVGEIGRYAVRRATERDAPAVRACLGTAVAVQSAILVLGQAAPRGIAKKVEALKTAVRKLEQLLYELSLVERSGRVRAEPVEPLADVPLGAGTYADAGDE